MFKLFIIASILFLVASCKDRSFIETHLPYYNSADFSPQWLTEREAEKIHVIPDFRFTNQDGKTITRRDFDNKITAVDFFFTSCPGICKKLTSGMNEVQSVFRDDKNVILLSHSVTPERDSVPVLKAYATEHGALSGKWQFVTGDRNAIYNIARTAYFADEDMGWKQDSSTFLHTENVLLIDKHHHIRGVYKGTLPLQIVDLISDIKKLEIEE